METVALTFRAEPSFIEAIRAYADNLGMSVNSALKEVIAPVIGYSSATRSGLHQRNDLARFCGALKDIDCSKLEAAQADFEKIDEDMWK